MDTRLLQYYNRELQYIREMGAEFAEAYPRIAARLGMDGIDCADPYVERLIEAFAFLAARVQLKLDARHPDFTQHLLEMVYPTFLAPVPSCAVAELVPALTESSLKGGFKVARGSALRAQVEAGQGTACEYRSAHDVTLWPLAVKEASYVVGTNSFASPGVRLDPRCRGAIRLDLRTESGIPLRELPVDSLSFFVYATADLAGKIYEQVLANGVGVLVRPQGAPPVLLPGGSVREAGFGDDEAMLPLSPRGFEGYRLLQEYFAFPERLLFFSVNGLRAALANAGSDEFELFLLVDRSAPDLENALNAAHFRLNCTPIVNLFPRSLDRIHLNSTQV